ncbi:MAG: winged helix-turn-helix domain-containing protein [Candidatus Eremiobacteraeota bacterium]|nr:winged helix-turn-helix domain-containing protein [Candidatus Eremiobacteraeota bacterium]
MDIRFGSYTLSLDERVLRRGDCIIALPPKAIDLLAVLARTPNQVVSKGALMNALWPDTAVEEGNLTQIVLRLRRAVQSDEDVRIETVPRRGYRLVVARSGASAMASRAPHARHRPVPAVALCVVATIAIVSLLSTATPRRSDPLLLQRAYTTWATAHSTGDVERAAAEFRQVLATDPKNAYAHGGLAYAYISLALREPDAPRASVIARMAFLEAREAVALDDHASVGHAALAQAHANFGDIDAAENEFKRAIALDPTSVEAHTWYGELLLSRGKIDDARRELLAAQSQNSSWTEAGDELALLAYLSRDFRSAQAYAEQSLTQQPQDRAARYVHALVKAAVRPADARHDLRALISTRPRSALDAYALLAYVSARCGNLRVADALIAKAQVIAGRDGVVGDPLTLLSFVGVYAAEHRNDDAFAWLQRVYRPSRRLYRDDARLDALRNDPRFAAWTRGA